MIHWILQVFDYLSLKFFINLMKMQIDYQNIFEFNQKFVIYCNCNHWVSANINIIDENAHKSLTLLWLFSNQWIIVIREKYVNKNMNHSFNLINRRSMILFWKAVFKIMWFVIIIKFSSSKYCNNFISV